ncbi:MAG: MOP flippase family protein [Candidatus Paceibacterota bacterium]
MNLKSTAISGVKWTSIEKIGKSIFQLLQIAILTRFLPKEAFGLVAIALVVIGFTNIFVDLGLSSAILYKQDATEKEYSSIYWLNIFISLFMFAFLLIITPFISAFYEEKDLVNIIPILGINLLLMAIGRQHRTIMQKDFRFRPITFIELIAYFLGLIVAIFLAYEGAGVYSLVYSTLLYSAVSNVLFLVTNIRNNPISLRFKINEIKPFLRVGGYKTGSRILDFISQEADIFIIGKILGAELLGVYTLSKQVVLKLYSLINPIIVNVLSPLLSSIQKDKERLKKSYLQVIHFLAYINLPLFLVVLAGSKEILYFLYGNSYVEAYLVLSFLSLYYCITSLSNPVGSLQIATGRTDIGFFWTILRVLITPAFIFIGALHSINGVAFAILLLGVLLLIPLWYIQLLPLAKISLKEYFQQFYRPLIIFLILGILAMYLQTIFDIYLPIISIFAKILFFLLLFVGILYLIDKSSFKNNLQFIFSTIKKRSTDT